METLKKENVMSYKIELYLAALTMLSTTISGSYLIDLLFAIITYTSARLFYYYFGRHIKGYLNKIKSKYFK